MRIAFWLIAFCTASTQTVYAQGNPRDFGRAGPSAERQAYYALVRTELNGLLMQWQRAWQRDDAPELASFYAEDGNYLPPGNPAIQTRSAIRDYFAKHLRVVGDARMQIVDFGTSGDLAYLTVRATYQLPNATVGGLDAVRTEMIVLRRRPNGSWIIATHLAREEPDEKNADDEARPDA
jgi:uncharacterized protein (TIGR02246 family)